jgi:hypothetical protein
MKRLGREQKDWEEDEKPGGGWKDWEENGKADEKPGKRMERLMKSLGRGWKDWEEKMKGLGSGWKDWEDDGKARKRIKSLHGKRTERLGWRNHRLGRGWKCWESV